MVNTQTITLESKTEDEPPPPVRKEGEEEQQSEEFSDSYEEISEAIDEAAKDSVLDAVGYIGEETINGEVEAREIPETNKIELEEESYFTQPEQEEYEVEYETREGEDEGIITTMQGEPFFRQEIDKNDFLIDDNPREDFESYFGLYGNAVARQGISFDCINVRRLLKNGIYSTD